MNTNTNSSSTAPSAVAPATPGILIEIETHLASGDFQLRIRQSWDDSLFFEIGRDWKPRRGFGHPVLGRLMWELRGDELFQRLPEHVVCHYPIKVGEKVAAMLRKYNVRK